MISDRIKRWCSHTTLLVLDVVPIKNTSVIVGSYAGHWYGPRPYLRSFWEPSNWDHRRSTRNAGVVIQKGSRRGNKTLDELLLTQKKKKIKSSTTNGLSKGTLL